MANNNDNVERKINDWFWGASDSQRCGYVRVGALKKALANPKVLDALLESLGVQGKPGALRRLPDSEKLKAIFDSVDEHTKRSKTSQYYGQHPAEVIAAAIWRSHLSNKFVESELFRDVRKEAHLEQPVVAWLKSQGLNAHAEIPMGKKRVDVVGHRPPAWGGLRGQLIVAVELKNEVKEFERAIDQMTTYRDYAHQVWLACTPAMAVDYLDSHLDSRGVVRWDHAVFDRKLQSVGFGLLLVEGTDVTAHIVPKPSTPTAAKQDEITRQLNDRTRR